MNAYNLIINFTYDSDAFERINGGAEEQRQPVNRCERFHRARLGQTLQYVEERDTEPRSSENGSQKRHRRQILQIVHPIQKYHRKQHGQKEPMQRYPVVIYFDQLRNEQERYITEHDQEKRSQY